MDKCYVVRIDEDHLVRQDERTNSYIGGIPHLPEMMDVPQCTLCGAEQTFFFQIELPKDHRWEGSIMAVFACTACADEDFFIPEMLPGKLQGIDIPNGFLDEYQMNFQVIVFKSEEATLKTNYMERVKYKKIHLVVTADIHAYEHKLGGMPNWLIDDEAPSGYNSTPMFFLMQMVEGYTFETVQGAPGQASISLTGEMDYLHDPFYRLFLSNQLYFFGTDDPSGENKVYVITQV